ncbi:MAG TPA: ATP phosphoribosyltransferase [Fibrobacteria bacterium]|nr:ATP phosphoribosyltransferase [Fibrobacteria bacterium]
MIKVALPNKGQLFEPTMDILSACGYKVSKSLRSLSTLDADNQVEFFFLRPGDIPLYVANGILDAGITGKDFVAEKGVNPSCLVDLGYGYSKLCAAVPDASPAKGLADLEAVKIATSFPNIVRTKFPGKSELVELEGAVEISIKLGIADAIVDIVETGTTLKQAGLRIVGEPLFESRAALYAHPGRERQAEVLILKSRIEGKLLAQEYMMVEYDAPEALLKAACAITPGIESPTVMSLEKSGWFSIKSMIKKRQSQNIMDSLSRLGCKGIILTAIDSVRI